MRALNTTMASSRRTTNSRLRVVSFVLMLIAFRSEVLACQCGAQPNVPDSLAESVAVFEGTVVATRFALGRGAWWVPLPEYEFKVIRVWKGALPTTVGLRGLDNNCAFVFRRGVSYLVYARGHRDAPGKLTSSKCDRTKEASLVLSEIESLGRPLQQFTATNIRSQSPTGLRVRGYLVGGVALFGNLLRHPSERLAWISVGFLPLILAVGSIVVIVTIVVSLRRRRSMRVLIMVTFALFLMVAALLSAGQSLFRSAWFVQYLQ
jgi:hypothetical protein